MPKREAVLTLNWPKNAIFQISAKKVSWLDKKVPAHFWITLGVLICKNHIAKPLDSFKECRRFLLSSQETFFAEI
jgi:hypothetical protein